jgi:transposase
MAGEALPLRGRRTGFSLLRAAVAWSFAYMTDVDRILSAIEQGDPRRSANCKQVSANAGLVPRQYQSGACDRRGRITRRGPRTLRKLLVECAWVMLRYNAWARAVYQRLTHGGKTRKKQAIVALARKLLVRCWAMLRDGTAWRAEAMAAAVQVTPSRGVTEG